MNIVIAVVIGYLLGSISFSYLITRKVAGIDIRRHGSGNAGATNTLRVIGKGPAVLVLILDGLKGAAAVWIASWLSGEPAAPALAGLAAVLGHNWPVFFGFKGGKGVATTIGTAAALSFFPTLSAGLTAILLIAVFRYVSLGSLVLFALIPILMFFKGDPSEYVLITVITAVLGYIRHRSNIRRLLSGTESKLGSKNK